MGQSTTPVDGDALEATPMTIDEKLPAPTKRERLARARTKDRSGGLAMTTKNNGPDAPVETPAPAVIDEKVPVPTKRDRLSKARTKDGLTLKELSFLSAYMSPSSPTYGNITRSALAARISRTAKSASVEGVRLLGKPRIQAALQRRMNRAGASWDVALERLAAMMVADIGEVMWWDEETIILRPFDQIPERARWAIKKISETQTPTGPKREIEMRDPLPAIKLLAQIMKKIGPETQVKIDNRQQVQADTLIVRGLTDEQLAEYLQMHDRLEAMGVIRKARPESPG